MKRLLALVFLSAPIQLAAAKCVSTLHTVDGTVLDNAGRPARDAVVAIAWSDSLGTRGPITAVTDENGRYEISFWFNTFSRGSFWRGDICKAVLASVSISARLGSRSSLPTPVTVSSQRSVHAGPIQLQAPSSTP